MNNVTLIGRLTKDPEVRWNDSMAIATFTVAIDRGKDKNGNDKGADFPRVTVFGRQAETVEKYLGKGRMVGIIGRIQTGSYERDGQRIYTTDVVADRVEFLDKAESRPQTVATNYTSVPPQIQPMPQYAPVQQTITKTQMGMPHGFEAIEDDDIPF